MQILVFSPTPTSPADQGNRQRVKSMCRALQLRGAEIHFAYFPREWGGRFSRQEHRAMTREWEFFDSIVPSKQFVYRTDDRHFAIDDWWDDAIGRFIRYKVQGQKFDACVVNYAFFSKAFEYLPPDVVRILDTHDRLSGRREMLEKNGVAPEFFYTTEAQEKVALDRADIVLAINAEEARFFRSLTSRPVVTLGHIAERQVVTRAPKSTGTPLRVGFLGSANSVNVKNMSDFLAALAREQSASLPGIELHLYGACCERIVVPPDCATPVRLFGRVPDIDTFYANVDCVVVPFLFGTGQKIKLIEALSYDMPLIATANASEGSGSTARLHSLTSFEEVIDALRSFGTDPAFRADLALQSRHVFDSYAASVASTLDVVFDVARARSRGITIDPVQLAAALRGRPQAELVDAAATLVCTLDMLSVEGELRGKDCALEAVRAALRAAAADMPVDAGPVETDATNDTFWTHVTLQGLGAAASPRNGIDLQVQIAGITGAVPAAPFDRPCATLDIGAGTVPGETPNLIAFGVPCPPSREPDQPRQHHRVVVLIEDIADPGLPGVLAQLAGAVRLRLGRAMSMVCIDAAGGEGHWTGTDLTLQPPEPEPVERFIRCRGTIMAQASVLLALGFSHQRARPLFRVLINDGGPLVSVIQESRALPVDGEIFVDSIRAAAVWIAHLGCADAMATALTVRRKLSAAATENMRVQSHAVAKWVSMTAQSQIVQRLGALESVESSAIAPVGVRLVEAS